MVRNTLLSVAVLLVLASQALGEKITVVTEEWPPYTYSEDGKIVGVVTEIVHAALDRSGLDYSIEVYPWARAYEMAKNGENVLIYSIYKLPSREDHFNWIRIDGLSVNMYLFRPKFRDEMNLTSLEQAKQYKIGVTRETSTHHFLLSKGFVEGVNLFPVNSEEQNALKSQPQTMRIDLTTGDFLSLARWLKVSGLPPDYWVRQELLFKEDFYMAFGLKTSDTVVATVRDALSEIAREGQLQAIVGKYRRMFE